MEDNEPKADISELIQLAFVGLIGANKEIEKVLKDFHEKHNRLSHGFLFYEFLVHQPLHKVSSKDCFNKIWIFSPIPHRLARRSLIEVTDEEIAKMKILIKMDKDKFTQHIYNFWVKNEQTINIKDIQPTKIKNILILEYTLLEDSFIDRQEFFNPFFTIVHNFSVKNMQKLYDNITEKETCDKLTKKSFELLQSFRRVLPKGDKIITTFLIPIASRQIFYGDLLVCVPHFTEEDYCNKLKQLASKLLKCIKKYYVPALALIHEHFFENRISKQENIDVHKLMGSFNLKLHNGKIDGSYESFICRRRGEEREKSCFECDYFEWEKSSDNEVEKYLHKLWQDRKTIREENYTKESLVFKNRLYTDPHMLDLLEGFLKPSKAELKKDGDYLPSVLVVAPPGAGKENIPRLLKLFSHCYNRGRIYPLNMSSLKPDVLAPIAMVGGEITSVKSIRKENYPAETYKLMGIFREIREHTLKDFETHVRDGVLNEKVKAYKENLETRRKKPIQNDEQEKLNKSIEKLTKIESSLKKVSDVKADAKEFVKELGSEEKLIVKELFGKFPTIVLDELNSLSVESQGVLLRFLENAEIVPIGGTKDEMDETHGKDYREFITDFLIVGLMNEDPEELTRETAIRFLEKESYIGGLLGDLLYEHILKIRRLRPDLRSRMMRNGKFEMPKLAERRADIPVIFYLLINEAKKDYFGNGEIRITMDALEYLMRPELEWLENVRLLQTLTKKIVEIVYEDYENKRYREEDVPKINGKELIIIKEKHIRQAMKEIGMGKEIEQAENTAEIESRQT